MKIENGISKAVAVAASCIAILVCAKKLPALFTTISPTVAAGLLGAACGAASIWFYNYLIKMVFLSKAPPRKSLLLLFAGFKITLLLLFAYWLSTQTLTAALLAIFSYLGVAVVFGALWPKPRGG